MRLTTSFAFFIGCSMAACSSRSPQIAEPAAPAPSQVATADAPRDERMGASDQEKSATNADQVQVSEDKSFQEAVYTASGMPSISEDWGPSELTAAGKAIATLAKKNRLFLPREGSPKSGDVFSKLISSENLVALDSPDAKVRSEAALELTGIVPQFLALYAPMQDNDAAFPREQVRWIELLLAIYPRALASMEAGVEKELISSEQLNQHRQIAVAVFQGAEGMLKEEAQYRESDLQILRKALEAHGPALEKQLGQSAVPASE